MATILCVEDDEELQKLLKIAFGSSGHEIISSPDGLDALRRLGNLKPDLILLDLMMPLASGDAVLGWLRSTEGLSEIPVFVLSAHPRGAQIADQLNADAFFAKPINMVELRKSVEQTLVKSP